MRSNTLDVQLRKKEEELQHHEQEIADQQQLHALTVKELEITKASLDLAQQECQQLKAKVGLEVWTPHVICTLILLFLPFSAFHLSFISDSSSSSSSFPGV